MKKISMKKRIASLVLVAVMLLSYIPGTAWAVDPGTDIKAIAKPTGLIIAEDYDDYFGDNWIDKLELPKFVTVTLANDSTVESPVTWDTSVLDPRTTGYYFLPGKVTLPSGATNGQNLDVTITIQVQEKQELFSDTSFESGNSAWRGRWYIVINRAPAAAGKYAVGLLSNTNSPHSSYPLVETTLGESNALATKVKELGAGQYYISAQSRDYDETKVPNFPETTHSAPMSVSIKVNTSKNANGSPITVAGTTPSATISHSAYAQTGGVIELTGKEAWICPQLLLESGTPFIGQWVLMDDVHFFPLKVALKTEPANIAEIKTEIPSRYVAVDYDKYVGENWQDALGLPKAVDVLTDKGTTGSIAVIWDYSKVDFSKPGKQVITGTLDPSGFPNPKNLRVEQNIYVRKMDNLFSNPSFEAGFRGTWAPGYDARALVTPAAVGNYALGVQSYGKSAQTAYRLFETSDTESIDLAAKVAALGAGQYYISAQARDYTQADEAPHTDALAVYITLYTSKTADKNTEKYKGESAAVTISADRYVTTGGVFELDGTDAWLRPKLHLKSSTAFTGEWVLADDMQFVPINVLIPKGEEPSDVAEIITEIPQRVVVKDYDKYVGTNWQEALGLPASVEVKTGKGQTASVGVIWDYAPLKLNKIGKYTLVGKLDDSLYGNPEDLYVTQTIYIREAKNLLRNSSLESGWNYWSIGYNAKQGFTPAAADKYAIAVQSSATWPSSSYRMIETSKDESILLASKIADIGAGQYYFSAQARDFKEADEVPHSDPLSIAVALYHSTVADMNTEKLTGESLPVALSDKNYVKASGIFELDGKDAWVRPKLLLKSSSKFTGQWILVDDMQLFALNTIVQKYEGAMEEVETVISDRNIIKDYPSYIGAGYTVADLMLPESVQVRSTKGELVNIEVTWNLDNLNLSKLGTYTLIGRLEDMKLENPDGLTVQQTIHVVEYTNLLKNPSFEQDGKYWYFHAHLTTRPGITSPVKDGDFSMKVSVGPMIGYTYSWLQALRGLNEAEIGEQIPRTGSGRYYFGVYAQGTSSSLDIEVSPRVWYQTISTGDQLLSQIGPSLPLSTSEFKKIGDFIDMPDDVFWARLDVYFNGTPAQMRQSVLYLDHTELVPLNVEVPNLRDIIDCEQVPHTYVHEGSSFADLKLPDTLEIRIKTAQKFQIPVKWNTAEFDPNKIGEQTITGALELGSRFKNSKGFVPTVKVTVRAKGDPLRETIYISTSGNESNDGLSPEKPKKDVLQIPNYLAKGYNVKLKRGDVWELPLGSFNFKNIHGTEDAPLVVGAYGSGGELPMIRFMLKIENSAWKLVDAKRNIYSVNVKSLGSRDGMNVHRCFVNDEAYLHKNRTNYIALRAKEFCSYNDTLYVRTDGGAPNNVEVTPLGGVANRLYIENVSHLTFEYIHFKGSSAVNNFCKMMAPTSHVKFQYISITHCFYYIITMDASDERVHYKPEISNCYIDACFSEADGYHVEADYWAHSKTEGITMRDGVDGAWIHHNHIRNMSHAFVAIETLDTASEPKITGVRNCIMEDNIFEGGNASYARAINLTGGFSQAGIQMCRDNIFRRNKCYDMSTSSHLYGENNLVYSNIFSYTHCGFEEDGTLHEGKSPQPWGFDTIPWGEQTCTGDVVVNNTFYDVSGAVAMHDTTDSVYNNLIANNLIVNWGSDPKTVYGIAGAIYDNTVGMQYVMNNGVYSHSGKIDHFVVDNESFLAEAVNGAKTGYSGNISGDPKFVNADLTQLGKGVRLDFTLSGDSPFRYAGLSINSSVYENFPAWKKLKAEYTDINGVLYLSESPSIGAISYCERIGGEVASVDKLEDIVVRTGATYESLPLPDTVKAKNDQGIEVVLLIDWNNEGYDSSQSGTVTLTGTLRNGPHTQLNVKGKTVSINIKLFGKLELQDIVTVVPDFTVFYNTSFEDVLKQLPQKLKVVEEFGFEEELPVTWICEDYNPSEPAVYTFKCILPEDLITNANDFDLEVNVRVLHEIGRGSELLVNPDFIEGSSASPWKTGWGTSIFSVTQDPQYLLDGEPAVAFVTADGRYASLQQDVTGQMKLMGDGKYLFQVYMRAYDSSEPIESSYACLQMLTPTGTEVYGTRAEVDIGVDWVCLTSVFNLRGVSEAREIMFHTSTGKTEDDLGKRFIVGGCSLVYLGTTDAEVEATLDSVGLVWNTIKGENELPGNVMSDLTLPSVTGESSTVKWSSSDENVITSDGKVIMGRVPQAAVLTATITHKNGITTEKKFAITVPRNPELPVYTGSLSGNQAVSPGDTFQVKLSLSAQNATAFNAYRFTLIFNTSLLEYVEISDPNSTAIMEYGQLEIFGIGTERPITDTITITFRAKKAGLTEIKLVKVEMDLDPNASLDALPTMTVVDGAALIDVQETADGDATAENSEKDNSILIYIVIGLVAAALLTGGAITLILIKKKKQTPPTEE